MEYNSCTCGFLLTVSLVVFVCMRLGLFPTATDATQHRRQGQGTTNRRRFEVAVAAGSASDCVGNQLVEEFAKEVASLYRPQQN
jgi:hypothetical protein